MLGGRGGLVAQSSPRDRAGTSMGLGRGCCCVREHCSVVPSSRGRPAVRGLRVLSASRWDEQGATLAAVWAQGSGHSRGSGKVARVLATFLLGYNIENPLRDRPSR